MNSERSEVMPVTVAGPSHARRYRNAIVTGQIAPPRRSVNWLDLASASMLHPQFASASFARGAEPTLCFVPDFRIGNRSLRDPDSVESYLGVAKDLITPENDEQMYANVLDRVRSIRDRNSAARFVFWCLGGREFQNRQRGSYVVDGRYRHPIWNLADVEKSIGASVISLAGIFGHPLGDMLHIDGSSHPSFVGLELFRRITDRPDVPVVHHLDRMRETLARPVIMLPRDAVLTGDSFWLEALRLYVRKGLVRLGGGLEVKSPEQLLQQAPGERSSALFISGARAAHGEMAQIELKQTTARVRELAQKGYRPTVFIWEARGAAVLDPRRRVPRGDPRSVHALNAALTAGGLRARILDEGPGVPGFIRARDVEVSHPRGPMPTLDGLLAVVRAIGGNHRLELV